MFSRRELRSHRVAYISCSIACIVVHPQFVIEEKPNLHVVKGDFFHPYSEHWENSGLCGVLANVYVRLDGKNFQKFEKLQK